jgi:hypothetical protein
MLTYDLDGSETKWRVKGREVVHDYRPRSALHKKARDLIKEKYPTLLVLEEVSLPIKRGLTLYFDFYLPLRKLAYEVHGEQHYKYNTMFHTTRQDFMKQRKNDALKVQWAEINGITVVTLPYNETEKWEEYV